MAMDEPPQDEAELMKEKCKRNENNERNMLTKLAQKPHNIQFIETH